MKSFALTLAVLGACGFSAGGGGQGPGEVIDSGADAPERDGAVFDAPVPVDTPVVVDAMPDAPPPPPTWKDVEAIVVPCDGTIKTSSATLATTKMYRFHAEGSCVVNTDNNSLADAEWHYWNIGAPLDGAAGVDNGLAVDDTTPGNNKNPRWGAYTATHVYETPGAAGTGSTITLRYHDSNYDNNDGSLTFKLQVFE